MMHIATMANFNPGVERPTGMREAPQPVAERAFLGVVALLFAVSVVATIAWCRSMGAMGGMAMPGAWTMSMAWMRMPGQSWADAAGTFVEMWAVMMVAMMLPSFTPTLGRYREAVARGRGTAANRLTAVAGLGYFFVWTVFGLVVYAAGMAAAAMEMREADLARAVPLADGLVVATAGALQFTRWKTQHLRTCREEPPCGVAVPAETGSAWRRGLHFGLHCGLSCANLTAILLALGVMDLRAMAAVTAAITAERLAPEGERVARASGAAAVTAGLLLIAKATIAG